MYVRGASNGLTVIHNAGFLTAITLNIAITSQLRFTNAIETALNKRERVKAYTRTFKPNKWAHVCVRNWQQAVTAIFCHLPRNHRRELTLKAPRIQAGEGTPISGGSTTPCWPLSRCTCRRHNDNGNLHTQNRSLRKLWRCYVKINGGRSPSIRYVMMRVSFEQRWKVNNRWDIHKKMDTVL